MIAEEPRQWRGSSAIIEKKGAKDEKSEKEFSKNIAMADVDTLVLKDHLLRKVEDVMDYAAVAVQKSSNS